MGYMNLRAYNVQHWNNVQKYGLTTQRLFMQLMDRLAGVYANIPMGQPFDLARYPDIQRQIERELARLANEINASLVNGIDIEWQLSNQKNDVVVASATGGRPIPDRLKDRYSGHNLSAMEAFKNRTSGGMQLSGRVWDTVRSQAINVERHMALGIYEGTSAKALASEMKGALNDPTALFRRVRDNEGNLRLSKAAKQYEAGAGRYRSAYKNALRMTRTETNLSYQQADNERWDKLDFVKGVRVRRSGVSPYDCDICDAAVGDYPKGYEWTALHPNCLCYAEPILATEKEVLRALEDPNYKFGGYVQSVPASFKNFQNRTGFEHFGH